jgi:hypothetical protein
MAAHQLAVAKANFTAVFLRPDPESTPKDAITEWHHLLDDTIQHCTRMHVQV